MFDRAMHRVWKYNWKLLSGHNKSLYLRMLCKAIYIKTYEIKNLKFVTEHYQWSRSKAIVYIIENKFADCRMLSPYKDNSYYENGKKMVEWTILNLTNCSLAKNLTTIIYHSNLISIFYSCDKDIKMDMQEVVNTMDQMDNSKIQTICSLKASRMIHSTYKIFLIATWA
ncbi:hypothetical protein RFI_38714 [Reticulomyxa filosa]|uniref:Uncharacterized protein n=1 Tax=Reticulomyxa filosa TaxID=46433 RepID=X6LB56_RETFI|nr:hypothetical protein RFI_38714 [Reticulomyxa filosa]|eukprot:ETN98773.1 hypothetical protein RFI_38714 [Reticulomyxa filosa]